MTRPETPSASATERLHRLEQEVETAVGHAVAATEASLARRFGAGCVRALRAALKVVGIAALIFYFVFGLSLLAARYWLLPRIDQARPWIEARASALLATDVRIGRIEASWRGIDPVLRLADVRLLGPSGEINLALPRVDATISWATAPLLWIRFQSLAFEAPELDVRRLADGRYQVAGYTLDPRAEGGGGALDWLLSQRQIEIRHARLRYTDESRPGAEREVLFDEFDFELRNGLATHRFALRGRPPPAWAGPLDVRGDFTQPLLARPSQLAQWRGRLFVQTDFIDLARVAAFLRLQAAEERIASAQGALRLWADIDAARPTRLVADLALADVDARWNAQTEPLRVRSLQGRLIQREWGNAREGGQEIDLGRLTVGGEAGGSSAPIGELRLRTTRAGVAGPARGELTVGQLELGAVARLAPTLPLPAGWREPLVHYAVGGRIGELAAQWQEAGDEQALRYSLRARFEGLRLAVPDDATGTAAGAGFANVAGSVELSEAGGTLRLAGADVQIAAPALFEEPRFALERLDALAHWTAGPRLEVRIESLAARNADLALTVHGTYRAPAGGGAAGFIDAGGTIHRASAAAAYRYLPRAAGAGVRNWLRDGLRDGSLENAQLRLRGELARFPWATGEDGEFRVTGELKDIAVDYQAGTERDPAGRARPGQIWPVLEGVRGTVLFSGNSMEVKASAGRSWGLRLTQAVARIPDLAHNARLLVRGNGGGPLPDMLRLVNQSPIARWTGNALAGASGQGNARFTLDLDVGLTAGAGAKVNGSVVFADNDLALGGDVPPLTDIDGTLRFDERGIAFQGLAAGFLGGRIAADASTRPDGAVTIEGNGTATVAAVGASFDSPLMRRLAAHAQGSLRYSGTLTLGGPAPLLEVRSDLVGVALALPPPLAKPADAALPLRLVHRTPTAGPDAWEVQAGDRLDVHLQRRRNARGELRLVRAAVGLNEPAALPDSGLRVAAQLERLDVAAWTSLLDDLLPEGDAPPAPGRRPLALPIVARIKAGTLNFEGAALQRVLLDAVRGTDGQWSGSVDSTEAAGTLRWQPATAGATDALVTARLSRLTLSRSNNDGAAQALADPRRELPAFDVVIDEFQLGPTRYGRLELAAVNTGSGSSARWELRKLRIANPDATLDATGDWTTTPSGQRMALKFALDIADGGALLARLGMPNVLRHAAGRMQGELAWRGLPTHLDLPSLDGMLALDLKQGQFLKADPGAARLLSLISLQALARTATLDFSSFDSGFAFTSIVANATVDDGTMTTRDFKMVGPAAAVLLDGSVSLPRETQNLRLLVLPDVGLDSASLLYAALINPAIGLGTFVAQMLLRDPLSKLFSVEYSVTGTWNEPVLKRIERNAPAPAAPAS